MLAMNQEVLMIDLSTDQSLACSIPLPAEYNGEEYDYRGISFSTEIPDCMLMDYDLILIYYGNNANTHILPVDYAFCVTSAELQSIADLQDLIDHVQITDKETHIESNPVFFSGDSPNIIAMGFGVSQRSRYIATQLSISRRNITVVDMDDTAMQCRLACQYDSSFRFEKISPDYKELIYRICCTLSGEEINTRKYKKIAHAAERGK
jgi:hypothetical protein